MTNKEVAKAYKDNTWLIYVPVRRAPCLVRIIGGGAGVWRAVDSPGFRYWMKDSRLRVATAQELLTLP